MNILIKRGGLLYLFSGISNYGSYLIWNISFKKKQEWYYLSHSWESGIRRFPTFPKSLSPVLNVIARLEFELVYDDVAVQ